MWVKVSVAVYLVVFGLYLLINYLIYLLQTIEIVPDQQQNLFDINKWFVRMIIDHNSQELIMYQTICFMFKLRNLM